MSWLRAGRFQRRPAGWCPWVARVCRAVMRQDLFDDGCFKTAAMTVNSHRTWGGAQGRILRAVDRGTAEITN